MSHLAYDREQLEAICKKWGVTRLSFFGSVLRDDFRPESDVDVLVEFEEGRTPGFAFFTLQDELAEFFGRAVDLYTPGCFGPLLKEEVLGSAQVQIDAA